MKNKIFCLLLSCCLPALAPAQEAGFISLLDRDQQSAWRQCGPGGMKIEDGVGTTWMPEVKGRSFGVAWYSARMFGDFTLKAEFRGVRGEFNSGLRLRFPRPGDDPGMLSSSGYEVSIVSPGAHRGEADMLTGAIAHVQAPSTTVPLRTGGQWNELEVTVTGQRYLVKLNGIQVNDFTGSLGTSGYIGLENHRFGSVQWRNVRIKEAVGAGAMPSVVATKSAPASAPEPSNIRDALLTRRWSWTHKNILRAVQVPKEVEFLSSGHARTTLGETWYWSIEGTHAVRVKFSPSENGIILTSDPAWQVCKWTTEKQAITMLRLDPAPAAVVTQTAAGQPRIEVLKEQGPNAVEWALAPLEEVLPPDIRQNLSVLREDLLDEGRKATEANAESYQLGSEYCGLILAALDQRELARVNAGYAAAQADADKRISNQALDARRNHQMSWPQYRREEAQRAALRGQQENAADVKKERLKVEWAARGQKMREHLDDLYRRFRESLRQ